MKTIQDLKENREVIIATISNEVGAENVKEVMSVLAEYVGFNGYFGMDAKEFTLAVMYDSGIADKIAMRNGARAMRRLEEINIEASKKLMENI